MLSLPASSRICEIRLHKRLHLSGGRTIRIWARRRQMFLLCIYKRIVVGSASNLSCATACIRGFYFGPVKGLGQGCHLGYGQKKRGRDRIILYFGLSHCKCDLEKKLRSLQGAKLMFWGIPCLLEKDLGLYMKGLGSLRLGFCFIFFTVSLDRERKKRFAVKKLLQFAYMNAVRLSPE